MTRLLLLGWLVTAVAGCAAGGNGFTTSELSSTPAQGAGGSRGAAGQVTGQSSPTATVDPRKLTFPPLEFKLPKSERVELKNGMVVYLLQDRELPIVSMTAYLDAGSIYEPAEKVGLATLAGATMRSGGTLQTPPDRLDRELEFMASDIEASIGADNATVSLSTLTRNLDRTLELFSQVMMQPAFDPARVELARNQLIEGIRRQNDDPKEIGDRELNRVIYAGHPLGRIPTIASVKGLTRDDLISFHERYFFPDNVILAVSGDFEKEKLLARLETVFAKWPNRKSEIPAVPNPDETMKPEVLLIEKDVNQSVIRMGHLGIDKNNPDLYAIKVMDYILGGGFTSRLTQEIRSNQGLAYNVDASFTTGRRFKGPFVAETETKSGSTGKAVGLLRSIIEGMTQGEVSDAELQLAKDAIINSFIFGFARSDAVVNQQARLEFYNFPPGYLENYRANIARVTREDVLRVARKYLRLDAMKLVVVGDKEKFDQPLSTFGEVREIKLEIK